ncbi:DUF5677 domain-containing protein [Xanthomonas campestris]|uniref:DUF5677 domain-containing protein n=1 Tax=Xanthomonas campestris TaxID=339 RepID=UPI002B232493|nr:DUF5677 domain-containing protein [Xanthomonas campestris]MEA9920770.1 DUF5677 domain-containing protein [Xanthomonas campestris pv. raphani]
MSGQCLDPINGRGPYIEKMLGRHAESLEITGSLATAGELFVAKLEISADDPHQLIPTCLLIRQVSGLRALALLAVNGFYTEALGHQRSLMEALARLSALVARPELLQDYLIQDVLNRKKMLGDILNFRRDWPPEMVPEPSDEELRQEIAEATHRLTHFKDQQGRTARDIKTLDWAQIGGVDQLMYGRFVMASEALHFSPKSLEGLLVTNGDVLESIRIGPEERDFDHLLMTSCRYVFVGIQRLANHLGVDLLGDVEDMYQRFNALDERMADDALREE